MARRISPWVGSLISSPLAGGDAAHCGEDELDPAVGADAWEKAEDLGTCQQGSYNGCNGLRGGGSHKGGVSRFQPRPHGWKHRATGLRRLAA